MITLRDDMAINKTEWAEINKLIEQATRPNGLKRVAIWLREWGIVAVVITAFLAIIALAVTLGINSFSRVEENAKFRQHTEDRLAMIEGEIAELRGLVLKKELKVATQLPQRTFNENLDVVNADLRAATKHALRMDQKLIGEVRNKIQESDPFAHSYWPTLSAFVSYSSWERTRGPLPQAALALPDCGGIFVPSGEMVGMDADFAYRCVITLDGLDIQYSLLKRAIVKFHGGPVIARDVRCVDCIFIVDLPNDPSPPARIFTRALLASSSDSTVTLETTQ